MKKTTLLFFVLVLISGFSFAQQRTTAIVQGEKVLTEKEINLLKEKKKLVNKINTALKSYEKAKLNTPLFINSIKTESEIDNLLHLYFDAKSTENTIYAATKRLDQLTNSNSNVSSHHKRKKEIDKIIKDLNYQRNNISKKKQKQKVTKSKIDFLAKDSKVIENKSKILEEKNDKKLDFLSNYNKKAKLKSIDDFISKSKSSKRTSDFLSSSGNLKGKIEYRENTQGVINDKGEILIPFKNWKIIEYKSGIALVSISLESYYEKCYGTRGGEYSANAGKTGYVDKNGKFIDGYKITFGGGWFERAVVILQKGEDNRSNAEKKLLKIDVKEKKS
ncbi:hypothetical protein [Polaribacter ponticola]|uniref:WG repeat-containing protein n=1 Tax=Polaribacter ponticola TaxID=2978475 RepID=A0ABT5SCR3_9FLAO|nr:hypothetical protein [Polaribacter sp. MSW5]MDD7915906.1 hypothetical protein [Polaribacter sp. MSW5]